MQTLKQLITNLKLQTKKIWDSFAIRERVLVVGGMLVIFVIVLSELLQPVVDNIDEQKVALDTAEQKLTTSALEIAKYQKLKARHAEIESAFKHVEMKEFMLSYLERLVRDTAGVNSDFRIADRPVKPFGGKYEQVPYSVKFSTNDMAKLIAFLTEVEQGEHPLILASVDLKRKQSNDGLNVELEVSSLRERSQNSEDS